MRSRVNVRAVVLSVGVAVILAAGVGLLYMYRLGQASSSMLALADRAEQQGRPDQAALYLDEGLRLRPDDAVLLARHGQLLARSPDPKQRAAAVKSLERATRVNPSDAASRRRLAELLMESDAPAAALGHWSVLLAASPDDPEIEIRLARCETALNHADRAEKWYREAARHAPDRVDVRAELAALLAGRAKRPRDADRVLDELIAARPRDAAAYVARARHRIARGLDGADDDLKKARDLDPANAEALELAAGLAIRRHQPDQARALLNQAVKAAPNRPAAYLALARIEQDEGRYDEAVACLRRGLEALPDREELRWLLADTLILAGRLDEAGRAVARLRLSGIAPAPLDYLEACLLIGRDQMAEGARAMERAAKELGPWPWLESRAYLYLGRCADWLGDPGRAVTAYRSALGVAPGWTLARLGLAGALAAQGRRNEAIGEYTALLPAVPKVRPTLVRLVIDRERARPAAERDWSEAERRLAEGEKLSPNDPALAPLRAELLAARGRGDDARRALEAERDAHPDRPGAWLALADLERSLGHPDRALALLREARGKLGDLPALRRGLIDLEAARPGDPGRDALAKLAEGLDAFSQDDRAALLEDLARAHLRRGDPGRALAMLDTLARLRPDDLRVERLRLDAGLAAGDEDAAARATESIRRIEGEGGPDGHIAEAARLLAKARRGDRSGLHDARGHLTEAARLAPDRPDIARLASEVAEVEGDADRALEQARRVVQLGGSRPSDVLRLVRLLADRGQTAEADRIVQRLGPPDALPAGARRLAAELALKAGDPPRALELATTAGLPASTNYRDQIALGLIRVAAGRLGEAEASFRRATELARDVPAAWCPLVRLLAQTGRRDEARAACDAAERAARRPAEPDPNDAAALAECLATVGETGRAEARLREALAARPDDPRALRASAEWFLAAGRPGEAEPLLRRIIAPGSKATDAEAAQARRRLALMLAATGDPRRGDEALALLDRNGGDRIEDRRARAEVLAAQPGRVSEALRLLDALARDATPSADEVFLHARLLDAQGRRDEAIALMRSRLSPPDGVGHDPRHLAWLASTLLRSGDARGADPWIAALERIDPRAFPTLALRARRLAAGGERDQAVALLRARVAEDPKSLGAVAVLAEDLGLFDVAEAFFRTLAAQPGSPDRPLVLAEYLGRRGRIAEALDLCDRAWAASPPRDVAVVGLTLLESPKATETQREAFARRLEEATARAPDDAPLTVLLGVFRVQQGRLDEAEAIYRRVIARDPRQTAALNNLAWLLAFRPGREEEALRLADSAIEAGGPSPDLLDTRAVALLALRRPAPAIEDLERAIARRPDGQPALYFHLARARQLARDTAGAAEALRRGKERGLTADRLEQVERPEFERLVADLTAATTPKPRPQ
jgi:tetratricopeptide (TPR) repeat protein